MKLFSRFSPLGIKPSVGSRALGVFVWCVVALMLPNLLLAFTEGYNPWSAVAGVVLPLGLYLLLSALIPTIGMTILLLLPVLALCAVQLVLLYLYGNSIISVDMFTNIFTTNLSESRELLGGLLPIIAIVTLLYLPLFALAIGHLSDRHWSLSERIRGRVAMVGAVLTIIGMQLLYPACSVAEGSHIVRSEIFPVNALHNLRIAIANHIAEQRYPLRASSFDHAAHRHCGAPQREIYLLVVGESSRAANWEMYGYPRSTNPRLGLRKDIVLFRNILTQSNTTHKSVPMMLSSADAENYAELFDRKGIADIFSQAGFRTCFISTQSPQGAMVDHLARECDDVIYIGAPNHDLQLLQSLRQIVDTHTDSDILCVLHCYGSHYRYNQRYPEEYRRFLPEDGVAVNKRNIEALRNAYDNSIYYTDALLDSLVEYLSSLDLCAALLYCSDHGEDLFDDERGRFLHASPKVSYYQLHVPCLAWFSSEYRDCYPGKVAMAQRRRWAPASTCAIFHTMADIASIESPYVDCRKSLTSVEFDESAPRLYLNDRNEAVRLNARIGIVGLDHSEFLRHGVNL